MIAKLVARGGTREEAMLSLANGLSATRVWPVKTNAAFLLAGLNDPNFRVGDVTTGLIGDRGNGLTDVTPASDDEWRVAALSLFAPYHAAGAGRGAGPWLANFGFRLNCDKTTRITLQHGGDRRALMLQECTKPMGFSAPVDAGMLVWRDAQPFLFGPPNFSGNSHSAADGVILAPMPGKVITVDVAEGQQVEAGQRLLVLEAMKMEQALTAPFAGTVAELSVSQGSQVQVEAILARIDAEPTD